MCNILIHLKLILSQCFVRNLVTPITLLGVSKGKYQLEKRLPFPTICGFFLCHVSFLRSDIRGFPFHGAPAQFVPLSYREDDFGSQGLTRKAPQPTGSRGPGRRVVPPHPIPPLAGTAGKSKWSNHCTVDVGRGDIHRPKMQILSVHGVHTAKITNLDGQNRQV